MMIIVFEDQNRIGIIRHAARKAADRLAVTLPRIFERQDRGADLSLPEFKEYALNLIDQIFQG